VEKSATAIPPELLASLELIRSSVAGSSRQAAPLAEREENFDLRALFRLGAWGGCAALALGLAVFALRSDIGAQRIAAAYQGTQTIARTGNDSLAAARVTDETRRLSEGLRTLSADRDRLLARVTVLERNLEDVTGSISRASEPKQDSSPASAPLPADSSIATLTGPTALTTAASITTIPASPQKRTAAAPARALAPIPAPSATAPSIAPIDVETTQSVATTSEFGVDIGGGASFEALRDLWTAARTTHPSALNGLRPLISVREGDRGLELRLVAGPLANAGSAAKICANLASGGWSCKPALFDGQKLTAR
jgi:hypothetical protein